MKKWMIVLLASVLVGCAGTEEQVEKKETTPKVKEESKKKEEPIVNKEPLSSDWKSMQIQIRGKVLTMPIKVKELQKLGFEFEKLEIKKIKPGEEAGGVMYDENFNELRVTMYNKTNKPLSVDDAEVVTLEIHANQRESDPNLETDIIFVGDIRFGDSMEKVMNLYGEPKREGLVNDGVYMVTYKLEDQIYPYVTFRFLNTKVWMYIISCQ